MPTRRRRDRSCPNGLACEGRRPGKITGRTEPEPDVALVRATTRITGAHPGPNDIALVVEVADTFLLKDRRRRKTYGPAGIAVYWIVNLNTREIEVYSDPTTDGYATRVDYAAGEQIPVVVDGVTIGVVAVADVRP